MAGAPFFPKLALQSRNQAKLGEMYYSTVHGYEHILYCGAMKNPTEKRVFTVFNPRLWALPLLAMLVVTVSGCGVPKKPSPPKTAIEQLVLAKAGGEQEPVQVDVSQVPALELKPRWSKSFTDTFTLSLAPDGSLVTVSSTFGSGNRKRVGFELYDAAGGLKTQHQFMDNRYRNSWAQLAGKDNLIMAGAHYYDQTGFFYLFDSRGRFLWSREIKGASTGVMSPAGNRLALIDHVRGSLHFLDVDGTELRSFDVSGATSAQFVADGAILFVQDESRLFIIDENGRRVWQYSVEDKVRRNVRISGDGAFVAVTTGEADSAVYLFRRNGDLVWSYLLLPGGTNELAFSPDSRYLAVFNVGDRGGLYLFEASTGRLLWRKLFLVPSDHNIGIRSVLFTEKNHHLIAQLVDSVQGAEGTEETHRLVLFHLDGTIAGQAPVGRNAEIHLSADGNALVAGTTQVASEGQPDSYILQYYSLGEFITPHDTEARR